MARTKILWLSIEESLNILMNAAQYNTLLLPILKFPKGTEVSRVFYAAERDSIGIILRNDSWPEVPKGEFSPSFLDYLSQSKGYVIGHYCKGCGARFDPDKLHSCSQGNFMKKWAEALGAIFTPTIPVAVHADDMPPKVEIEIDEELKAAMLKADTPVIINQNKTYECTQCCKDFTVNQSAGYCIYCGHQNLIKLEK